MNRFHRSLRLTTLAAATAAALAAAPAAFAGRVDLSGLETGGQYDQFIVRYRSGSAEGNNPGVVQSSLDSTAARAAPLLRASSDKAQGLRLNHLRRLAVDADVVHTDRKLDRNEAQALLRELAADPDVEYAEVDIRMHATFTPNDPRFNEQWNYFEATGGIRADQAWDITSGSGTVIAVLDTGITNHSDLNANVMAGGFDFIADVATANDGNGRDSNPSDPGDACGSTPSSWHGTHVSGTAAAVTNNGNGVAGVAFGARILPVRVLGVCGGFLSDISDAIIWASGGTVSGVPANTNPAEAINLSLGGGGACTTTMQNAINGAVGRGTTVVVAAGNGNANVSTSTPANCNNVIAVGSTTRQGARSSFSNFGTGVDVAAPGSSILSTLNTGTTSPGTETYVLFSGTSMSTPHVAGTVALMQSVANPALTPAQVETLLKNTARAFPVPPPSTQRIGTGIIDARAAVDAVTP